jgi:hypothetical protein
MSDEALTELVKKIDVRAARMEQYLPTLATREELQAAVAPLATREEMYVAIQAEGDRARQHATMLFENLREDNRLILDHLLALSARVDALARR